MMPSLVSSQPHSWMRCSSKAMQYEPPVWGGRMRYEPAVGGGIQHAAPACRGEARMLYQPAAVGGRGHMLYQPCIGELGRALYR